MYCVKTNSHGSVIPYKECFVAQGCPKTRGIDYNKPFYLVVKYEAIQAILALVAQSCVHKMQFDMQAACLHRLINTTLYILDNLWDTRYEVCIVQYSLHFEPR